jgi:hypothetical protein
VPSAIGVQHALAPTRGAAAGWLEAAGFELVYLSTAILSLSPELRAYAQRVALAAVGTAIVLNTIADYSQRVPGGLANAAQAWARFDILALALSLVESLPLAGLAYAMATLLHRLSEADVRRVATDVQGQLELAQRDAQIGQLRTEAAQLAEQSAALRTERDTALAESARLAGLSAGQATEAAATADQLRTELSQVRAQSADLAKRAAAAEKEHALSQTMLRDRQEAIDHLSAENTLLSAVAGLDGRSLAQTLRDRGVSLRTIGDALGVSEKTIRNWTMDVRSNGHATPQEA